MLVLDWQETLSDVSDAEFLDALREVKRRQRFFPVPADVYAAVTDRRRQPATPVAALPESTRTREEQIALNLKWARRIAQRAGHPVRVDAQAMRGVARDVRLQ